MFIEVPNFIPPDKLAWLRERLNASMHLSIGSSYNRAGDTVSISQEPSLQDVDAYLHGLFGDIVNDYAVPSFSPLYPTGDSGYEFHRYPTGSVCKEHVDGEVFAGRDANSPTSLVRYATVVLHLTTNDGELVFPKQNKRIKTEAGKLVMFPPNTLYPHYTTASNADREIVMTWLVYSGITAVRN